MCEAYIVLTQRPTYQAEAGWRNDAERPGYIQANKLRFLRPYQLKAVHSLQAAVDAGKDRFLFEMATGMRAERYFPIRRRRRTGTEQSAAEAIHFILFYPFLVFELAEEERRRRIAQKRQQIDEIIATETQALATVRRLEELFCENENDHRRVEDRWSALDAAEPIVPEASGQSKAFRRPFSP